MTDASSKAMPSKNDRDGQPLAGPTLYRIQFVEQAAADQAVLVEFRDPAPRKAVRISAVLETPPADSANPDPDVLEIVAVPWDPRNDPRWRGELQNWIAPAAQPGAAPPIVVKVRDAQVTWRPGRAVIQGAADHVEPLLAALVDFGYYEAELRRLEQELADSWQELEEDAPLAYEVTQADMARRKAVGRHMEQTLRRRMRQRAHRAAPVPACGAPAGRSPRPGRAPPRGGTHRRPTRDPRRADRDLRKRLRVKQPAD